MKLQHTFKILQQRYFITVNMANIGIIRHNIPQSCVLVAPELRSGKNYDRWGPRNGLSQFLGAQELSSAAFWPTLTTGYSQIYRDTLFLWPKSIYTYKGIQNCAIYSTVADWNVVRLTREHGRS